MPTPSPGQVREAERILGLVKASAETGRGNLVFLAGEQGSGRTWLMRYLATALEGRGGVPSHVLFGGPAVGRLAPSSLERESAQRAVLEATAGAMVSGAALVNPAFNLVSSLLDLSVAATRVAESIAVNRELTAGDLLVRTLRAAAAEDRGEPLVCLIDGAEALDAGWWAQLQFSFAQEVHERLPLVLVVEVDGGAELKSETTDDDSPAIATARSLLGRDLALWAPLTRLSADAMREWLGPMSDPLAKAIVEVSGGRSGIAAEIWGDWGERGMIGPDESGAWQFLKSSDGILANVADDLSGRILQAVGSDRFGSLDRVRALLACAALEGRAFSAEAVARALGWQRDEAIDCFDLLVDEDGNAGVLVELGAVQIADLARSKPRSVWRYRFVRDLDWRTARTLFSTERERREMAASLVAGLVQAYEPEIQPIVHRLVELSGLATDAGAAARFRRLSQHIPRAGIRAQAELLLGVETVGWSSRDYCDAAHLLIDATRGPKIMDPTGTEMRFAERAEVFGCRAGDAGRIVTVFALSVQAAILRDVHEFDAARDRLDTAYEMVTVGAPSILGGVLSELARLEEKRGTDLVEAQGFAERALRILRREGELRGLAQCHYYLGEIAQRRQDHEAVFEQGSEALRLARTVGDDGLAAAVEKQLAIAELNTNREEAAHHYAVRSLTYYRQIENPWLELEVLETLAVVEFRLGRHKQAWSYGGAALRLGEQLPNREPGVLAPLVRGAAAIEMGRFGDARHCLEAALARAAEVGDVEHEEEARELLDEL